MENNIETIKDVLDEADVDIKKLENKGVKAAAPRARKKLMEVIRACKILRKKIMETKSTL